MIPQIPQYFIGLVAPQHGAKDAMRRCVSVPLRDACGSSIPRTVRGAR
jgi:hypothetical protein